MSPKRKMQLVAVRHPDMNDTIRIYMKGAPEKVLAKCKKNIGVDGEKVHMDDGQLDYIKNDIVTNQYAMKGYRPIVYAYKDIEADEFENLKRQYNNFQTEKDRKILQDQLCFIAAFALQDDLRDKVK